MDQQTVIELRPGQIVINERVRSVEGEHYHQLVASVRKRGVLQPILVVKDGRHFRLVAGYQRLAAALEANIATVPVRMLDLTDAEALEAELAENMTRSDLNPIEEAQGFARLWQVHGVNQEQIAEHFGLSIAQASDRIRLLRLPKNVQDAVAQGKLAAKAALYLLRLEDDPKRMAEVGADMIAEGTPAARAGERVGRQAGAKTSYVGPLSREWAGHAEPGLGEDIKTIRRFLMRCRCQNNVAAIEALQRTGEKLGG